MRQFVTKPSPGYQKAVAALRELPDTDQRARAYAQSVYAESLEAYTNKRGLKPTTGTRCVCRLISKDGRCHCNGSMIVPGRDHSSLWLKDGKPYVYITQPYHLDFKTLQELVSFCDDNGLTVSISPDYAWHFPGSILFVEIKKMEVK